MSTRINVVQSQVWQGSAYLNLRTLGAKVGRSWVLGRPPWIHSSWFRCLSLTGDTAFERWAKSGGCWLLRVGPSRHIFHRCFLSCSLLPGTPCNELCCSHTIPVTINSISWNYEQKYISPPLSLHQWWKVINKLGYMGYFRQAWAPQWEPVLKTKQTMAKNRRRVPGQTQQMETINQDNS